MERKYWCLHEIQGLVATGHIEPIQKAYLRCYDQPLSKHALLLALGLPSHYTYLWVSIVMAVQLYWGSCVEMRCECTLDHVFIRRKTNVKNICACIRDRAYSVKQLLKTSHRRTRKHSRKCYLQAGASRVVQC